MEEHRLEDKSQPSKWSCTSIKRCKEVMPSFLLVQVFVFFLCMLTAKSFSPPYPCLPLPAAAAARPSRMSTPIPWRTARPQEESL